MKKIGDFRSVRQLSVSGRRSVVGGRRSAAENCHGRSLVGGKENFKFEDRLCKTTSSVLLYDNLLKKQKCFVH